MTVSTAIEVNGLGDKLRAIGKIDKALRKQLTRDFTDAAQPMLNKALSGVPSRPPLSGWANNWKGKPLWTPKDSKAIALKVDTRRPRRRPGMSVSQTEVAVLKFQTKSRGTAIFDMAGKGDTGNVKGRQMIEAIEGRYQKASRVMWSSAESTIKRVTENLKPVVAKVEAEYTRLMK